MTVLVSIIGVWGVTLALLLAAGYGIGRWLTPPVLRPYELWLTPLWGYGLLVFVAYYGLTSVLTLRSALVVALLIALMLAGWRLIRPGAAGRWPRAPLLETLPVLGSAVLAGLLGVVPLLRAGYLLPIGHGWDIEFYLPLATYLQDYSYASLASAPAAPLRNVILAEPTSVRAIGFSYVHGMVDLIGGWSSVGTFPILLALFRALSIVPVYLLLRVGLRAGRAGAALGALLVALNELLLWISYNNFAMHVSSMPLVPLATLFTLLVLRGSTDDQRATSSFRSSIRDLRSWTFDPALAGAIAATTMIALSYHPALLAYGALAGGLGAWALIVNRDKLRTLSRGLAIIVGCLVFGWLAHWRAPVAFFDVYAQQTPSIGGERFARLTELFGVEAFHHQNLALEQPAWMSGVAWLALGALLAGIGLALWQRAVWRGPALGLLAFALLYALGLRFVIAFPYGFYKGVSYLSFVPLGIAGVGLATEVRGRRASGVRQAHAFDPRRSLLGTLPVGALALLVVSMSGWSTYRLLATYRAPVLASGDIAAFSSALRALPDDGTVALVDHPELRGPPLGIVALGLYGHPWIGRGQTGFAVFNNAAPGTQASYGLMHVSDDPRAWGFEPQDVVTRAGAFVLYRAPANAQAFLSGNAAAYERASGSLRQRLNSLQVQDLTHGNYQMARPDAALSLYATDRQLSWTPIESNARLLSRSVKLDVASSIAQTITIAWPSGTQSYDIPRGSSRIMTPTLADQAAAIQITPSAAPLVVRSAQVFAPGQAPGVTPLADTLAIATTTQPRATSVTTRIDVTSATPDVLRLGLELYEISEATPRRYAGGVLAVRANEAALLALDLQTPAATLNGGQVPLVADGIADGKYFGALWLYQGNTLIRRVPFVRFERRAGQIMNVQALDANATFARMPEAVQSITATLGPVQLTGFQLTPTTLRPGATAQLGLQWQVTAPAAEPLLVFAQVLGPDDHKWAAWDGAAGGDWWPAPAWQPGDRIRQDVPLALDPATPPGRYRLAVGLYKASTGERLPISGPQAQNGLLVLQEITVDR